MAKRMFNRAVSAIGATLFLVGPVAAETGADGALDEVIVTAQKREQNLQQVGIAVTAFSGKEIENLHIDDAQGLADQVAGLNLETPGTPANTTFTLRGVGQRDIAPNVESAAVIYRDNAYAPVLTTAAMPMYDIERVEVLKGPQGTLFGRNATGGLIHILSKSPGRNLDGYVKATGGEYGEIGLEGALGGPLTDTLAGRISLFSDRYDGYIENTAPGGSDGDRLESYSARGQLLYQPTDSLDALLIGHYTRQLGTTSGFQQRRVMLDQNGLEIAPPSPQAYTAFCAALDPQGLRGVLGLPITPPDPANPNGTCYSADDDNPYRQPFNSNDARFLSEFWEATLSINYEFGDGPTLTSISDYQNIRQPYIKTDPEGSAYRIFSFSQSADSEVYAQELRLTGDSNRTRWVAGLYYLNIDQTGNNQFLGTDDNPAFLFAPGNDFDQETESIAGFGQIEYDFAERWTVLAGARWTEDRKRITYTSNCTGSALIQQIANLDVCDLVASVFPDSIQFNGVDDQFSFNKGDWSGKLEVDFRPNSEQLFYASVSRGIKSGGFNFTAFTAYGPDVAQYDGETLIAYEAGSKSTLFGGSTRLNAAVYYYDYSDFQNFLIVGGVFRTINVSSTIKGMDLELTTSPWRGWYLQLGANYLDTGSTVSLPLGGTRRDVNPGSPEWSWSALARYEWPAFGGTASVQTDWAYKGERSTNGVDNPVLRAPSFVRGNVSLSYTTDNGHWSGSAFVNNVTDEQVDILNISLAGIVGSYGKIYDKPRWAGGSIQYRW